MKKGLFALVSLFLTIVVNAQTADEVINKYIDAVGGKGNVAKLTSVYMESKAEVMGNSTTTFTTVLNGRGFKSEADLGGQKIVQAVNTKGGWAINPFAGGTPQPMPAEQYKLAEDQMYAFGPVVDYASHGGKVELVGQEKVGTVNAYKLKYTNRNNAESFYYFDAATYYLLQVVKSGSAMGQNFTIKSGFSNYTKTDIGVLLPYTTTVDAGQFALTLKASKVEVNKPVDTEFFEMPSK